MDEFELSGYKISFTEHGGFVGPTFYMTVDDDTFTLSYNDELEAIQNAKKILLEKYNITEPLPLIKFRWGNTL